MKIYNSLISILLIFSLNSSLYTLLIREVTEGRNIASISVSQEDLVKIEYNHSMYNVKQKEIYSIGSNSKFYLKNVEFGSYAAAIYYNDRLCGKIEFNNGIWKVKGSGESYSILKFWVSLNSHHTLEIRDVRINLYENNQKTNRLIEIFFIE